jgi:hypothetical protein
VCRDFSLVVLSLLSAFVVVSRRFPSNVDICPRLLGFFSGASAQFLNYSANCFTMVVLGQLFYNLIWPSHFLCGAQPSNTCSPDPVNAGLLGVG